MEEDDFETEDPGERAHDLYWGSDRSVNSIAEELGLSKGGLYQHILPLPAEGTCPRCGGSVGYFNRTARDRNEPTCIALCDNEEPFPLGRTPRSGSTLPPPAVTPSTSFAFSDGASNGAGDGAEFEDDFAPINSDLDDDLDPYTDGDSEEFEEIAFEMEGGFPGFAGAYPGDPDPGTQRRRTAPPPPAAFLDKVRSPLSESEKVMVAGVLLAAAGGLLLLRLARKK